MDSCLVGIYLQITDKGNLKNRATICLPQCNDIKLKAVMEPHHEDCNAKARKDKKNQHRQLLKQLRRKRIKCKKKAESKQVSDTIKGV